MLGIVLPIFGWWLGKNHNQSNQNIINDGLITGTGNQIKTNALLIDACKGLVRVQKNNLKIMENNLEIQKRQFKQRVENDKRKWQNEIIHMETQLSTETNPHIKKIIAERIEFFKRMEEVN